MIRSTGTRTLLPLSRRVSVRVRPSPAVVALLFLAHSFSDSASGILLVQYAAGKKKRSTWYSVGERVGRPHSTIQIFFVLSPLLFYFLLRLFQIPSIRCPIPSPLFSFGLFRHFFHRKMLSTFNFQFSNSIVCFCVSEPVRECKFVCPPCFGRNLCVGG